MSGPKSSSYRLSAAQRRALQIEAEKRRQEQIRKEKVKATKEQISTQIQRVTELSSVLQAVLGETFLTKELRGEADVTLQRCHHILHRINECRTSDDLTHLESERTEILQSIKETRKAVDQIYTRLPEVVSGERYRIEDEIASGFNLVLPDHIQEGVKKNEAIRKAVQDRLDEIRSFNLPPVALKEWEQLKSKAASISSVNFLENFLAIDIDPFIIRCQVCGRMDYIGLRAKYEILAQDCHKQPKDFDFSEQGIAEMKAAIADLEAISLEEQQRTYIDQALEEVLLEMGYSLVGDRDVVRKKTGKRIHHELYTLRPGTAVDVTYSDNGQISMELGGIGYTDRGATAEETEQLVEDMKSFCQDYAELEKKLQDRGILTTKLSHMPPTREHAKIINANDYSLTQDIEEYQVDRSRRPIDTIRYME